MHRTTTKWLNTIGRYAIILPTTCYGQYNHRFFNCREACLFRPVVHSGCKEFTIVMTLPIEELPEYLISSNDLTRKVARMRMEELGDMFAGWAAKKMVMHYFKASYYTSLCGKVKRKKKQDWLKTRAVVEDINGGRRIEDVEEYEFCTECEELADD